MPKTTLAEEMHKLFDDDEDVKEYILLGKLPPNIAELAAAALEKKEGQREGRPISFGSSEPFMHVARLIQARFWPKAPALERGGFMKMLSGTGPAPSWVVIMQVAAQVVEKVRESGFEVEESEGEKLQKDLDSRDKLDLGSLKDESKLADSIYELDEAVKRLKKDDPPQTP